MRIKETINWVLMIAAGLCTGTSARPAHAAESAACTVTAVRYETTKGGTLGILCDGNWYSSTVSHENTTCNQVLDKHKLWLNLVQAAQLSGKKLKIGYNTASQECMPTTHSTRSIWFLEING